MSIFLIDGTAFVLIGLIVLSTPSPQPALVRPVDTDVALQPFKDTRRLLASQFFGNGLLALVVGLSQCGADTVRLAAIARIATIAMVLGINVSQIRQGRWKRPPLYVITAVLGLVAAGYVRVVFSSP